MFAKLFSTSEVDAFARALAAEIAQRYPVQSEASEAASGRDHKAEQRLARALESVFTKAEEFRQDKRLGVYRKARLGNTFKWELRELGYSDPFVEKVTNGLITSIASR